MLIVLIPTLAHLRLPLDFVEHDLDEHAGFLAVEVAQLDACLQILLDISDHLLIHFDIRVDQLADHELCLLVDALIFVHQLHA